MNTIEHPPSREPANQAEFARAEGLAEAPSPAAAAPPVNAASVKSPDQKGLFEEPSAETISARSVNSDPGNEKSAPTRMPAQSSNHSNQNGTSAGAGSAHGEAIEDALVKDLDDRMAKSELEELGWRDRTDLSDMMRDLERLAGLDWRKAATLWDKYRPGDEDKPIFIDGDDKDGPVALRKQAQSRSEEFRDAVSHETLVRGVAPAAGAAEADDKLVIPQSIVKRYLVADNKFYFRGEPELLAFEDKGKRLATKHDHPEVARSMVELAEAKRWTTLKVNGTKGFRREVWRFASLRGLEVQGYEPSNVEKAELAERLKELQVQSDNVIEQGVSRERATPKSSTGRYPEANPQEASMAVKPDEKQEARLNLTKQQKIAVDTLRAILTERGDSATAVEMAAQLASERFQEHRVYVGRLVAHGSAPYNNDPNEKPNYFVTLKTINGERTVWGVDLERAINADETRPGDDVAIAFKGKKRVKVLANERDANGSPTGRQIDAEVDRNTWEVAKLDRVREEAHALLSKAATQTERNEPTIPVHDIRSVGKVPDRIAVEPAPRC